MHYLVTEADWALLSLLWWMVLGAPQWPQWLASADNALNGFSRNLIAAQSPQDTTRLQLPLQSPTATEIETEPVCLFPQDAPLTLSSSFWRKAQQRQEHGIWKKRQQDSWGHRRSNQSLQIPLIKLMKAPTFAEVKWHLRLSSSPFSNPNSALPSV